MEFSLKDVKTLKYLNKEKLDFYIDYLSKNNEVKRASLEKVDDKTREITLLLDKKATVHYAYAEEMENVDDIFDEYDEGKEPQLNIYDDLHTIIKDGTHMEVFTPHIINFYINQTYSANAFRPGNLADNIENGYFLTLLKLLKEQLREYEKDPQYYEDKYGAENLISLNEDCENGRKAGNMAVATNDAWEKDWKEFIKHDMQWDGGFFFLLIVHKLELMRKYYDPDTGNTSLCRRSARRNCQQIDKALKLSKYLDDDAWIDEKIKNIKDPMKQVNKTHELWNKAKREFFLYLADHYDGWWD